MRQVVNQATLIQTTSTKSKQDRWVVALRTRPGLSNPMKTIVQVDASSPQEAKNKAVRKVCKDKKNQFRNIHCFIFDTVEKAEEENGNRESGNTEGETTNG